MDKLSKAEHLYQNLDFANCLEICENQINSTPNTPRYLELGAKSAFALQDYAKSIGLYEKLLDQIELTEDIALQIGRCKQLSNDINGAESWYRKCLDINPIQTRALNNLGIINLCKSEYSKGEAFFLQAISIDNSFYNAHMGLSQAYFNQKKYKESIEYALTACNLKPGEPRVELQIAKSWIALKEFQNAIASLERELLVRPTCLESQLLLGSICRQNGQITRSVNVLKRCIGDFPSSSYAHLELGISLYEYNRPELALQVLEKAIELDPDNNKALTSTASILHNTGKFHEAIEKYQHSIQIKPSSLAYTNLSKLYGDMNDPERQLNCANMAVELSPNDGDALINLANIYKDQGNIEQAKELISTAISHEHCPSSGYLLMARILSDEYSYIEARKILIKGLEIYPTDHFISGELARVEFLQNEYESREIQTPWGKDDEYYFEDCNGSSLIISFGSNGKVVDNEQNSLPPLFNFRNTLDSLNNYDKLFLRDMQRNYYMHGLKGCAPSIQKLCKLIENFSKAKKYKNIVTLGASSGGFGALLYGNLINANKIVAFNPQTVLSIEKDELIGDTIFSVNKSKKLRSENKDDLLYQKCLNLRNFVPFTTSAIIHFSNKSKDNVDKRYAEYLSHENCKLVEHNSITHLLAHELRQSNLLLSTIVESLNF